MITSDWAWAGWAAGGLASFAVLEALALREYPDPRHTLTAATRRMLGIYPVKPRRAASSAALVGALATFAAHMLIDPPPHQRYHPPVAPFV